MDRGHELTEELLAGLEKRIAEEYAAAVKDIGEKANAYFAQFRKDEEAWKAAVAAGKRTEEDFVKWRFRREAMGDRWNALKANLAADLDNARNIALKMAGEAMPDVYALNGNFSLYQIESQGVSLNLALYNHDTAEYLLRQQRQLMPPPSEKKAAEIAANKSMQWDASKIQSAVTQGILQGESADQIAQRLMKVGEMEYKDAIRYARTMTTSAQNAGRYESFRRATDLGVNLVIEWVAVLDGHTRDAHRHMHGERTTVDEPFETPDGYEIYYPADCSGESDAPQEEIWNCRCTLIAWVEGFEGETVRESAGLEGMSFEEWLESG